MGKWTRRGFITAGVVGGSALIVGVAIRPGNRVPDLAKLTTEGSEALVNAWVKIDADNKVTAIVPHSEMGQGAQTALTQMLADELDANWADVSFMEAPAEDEYANWALGKGFILGDTHIPDMLAGTVDGVFMQVSNAMHLQVTGGSLSVRSTGVYGMRVAGAAAKEMLIASAADAWDVKAEEISTSEGMIHHKSSGQSAAYATFAAAAGQRAAPRSPTLKNPDEFTIMGKSKPRLDIPSKVDGSALFGMDVEVDNMKIATIKAAPVFGATLDKADTSKAATMPGVIKVVELEDAVAVVANGYWQAKQALATTKITWSKTENDTLNSEQLYSQFNSAITAARDSGDSKTDVSLGDSETALKNGKEIAREYSVPFLAHACMEPMNAVAHYISSPTGDTCEIWTGTQNPLGCKHEVAAAFDIDPDNVKVNNYFLGGGFGRRSKSDTVIQAAKISKAVGTPVKLIWSREEDIQHDHYRPAVASHFQAVLDDNGLPLAWQNQYVDKHEPVEAPHIPYDIANQSISYADSPTHVPFGAWRSVDHSQHGFFTESFIDELAIEAKVDPYLYRQKLLSKHPRHLKVLDLAAEKANWNKPLAKHQGRGISLQNSFGTLVAEVVEISVIEGKIKVDRVVVVVDAGFAVSPDGLIAQMESGVIYGLTAALYGDIQIEEGKVKQGNFDDYHMVRMSDAPIIETHIINSMENWGGAGEPGTPGTAPALANAIFDATGTRVRKLPVSNYLFDVDFLEKNVDKKA
ncbi:MAG: isoquinoline 1-oxidoreductase beta subunit [Candidatus Azotimanducaceae bacterium]|jgi:isoquinoline 1-oxidoreductase beta subunit